MSDITLLGGEELKMKLRPHMFSFFNLYFVFFLLLLWGYWIYDFFTRESFTTFPAYDFLISIPFINEVTVGALCWSLGLFIVGFAARYFFMDSGGQGIFLLYSGIAVFGILALSFHQWKNLNFLGDTMEFGRVFIPGITFAVSIIGIMLVDTYRRSFTYFLTDNRIVLKSNFLMSRSERQVRYNHIEDIKLEQGIIGSIFGYGTVLPLTGSGLGTGTDESMVVAGAGSDVKGLGSIGFAGGTRSSSKKIRHNPNDCLYGVPSPGKVRDLITENIQADTGVEHLKNIKELLSQQDENEE